MANSNPVWHDIFRYVKLLPDNITLEAETYKDTLNILRGNGVSFGSNIATDSFSIDVDYDISVPVATTKISLEDINGNLSEITLKAGRGVNIVRNSAQELEFESFSVTETDTLQTVTERNNITNNKIFVNNIEVGTISSSFTEDGFSAYDAGHNLIGDGTLDNPLKFSPLYQDSIAANNTDQFEFTALGPGTLAYSANYVFDNGATTGSVTIEREDPSNPGTWVTLDTVSGNTIGIAYDIQGIYSELYSGNVNYRLTYTWTGNAGVATWYVYNSFEGGAYTPINDPQLKTDTDAKTVQINDLLFFQNNIRTTISNTDIVLDPAGTGKVIALSNVTAPTFTGDLTGNVTGNIISSNTSLTILNTSASTAIFTGDVTGNVSGNAGTVTDGVYTTGSYADPSWLTSLDASKIIGSITLSDITIDGDIRIFDNVITTTLSNSNLELRANGTGSIFIPDNLTVTNSITFNTTTNNQSYTTTGAGTITITSGTTGSINNIQIGNSTRASGAFTTLDANSTVGLSPANANVTISPTGTGTVSMAPATAGNINNMNIGASTRGTGAFTTLDANSTVGLSPANAIVTISPTGTGTVTIAPATGGSIDNMNIGTTTRGSGAFTTLAANGTTTLQQITEVLNTKTSATGVVTHDYSTGTIWWHSSISANFTVNLTNVPTTNDRTIVVTLLLNQGGTGYYPNVLQIAGTPVTIRWANNITPTPSTNKIDVVAFTLIRTGSTWYALGNYTPYA